MLLKTAHVTKYKSIEDAGPVAIDPTVTVLVGQNESGKTVFLEALHKARSVEEGLGYDYVEDYPRRWLSQYEPVHGTDPATVVRLTYELTDEEVARINEDLGVDLLDELSLTDTHKIDDSRSVGLSVPESRYVEHLLDSSPLPEELRREVRVAETIRELISALGDLDLNEEGVVFRDGLRQRFPEAQASRSSLLAHYVLREHLGSSIPAFLYFDEYKVLPGKVNLDQLMARRQRDQLTEDDRTVLGLLRLASIDLSKLVEEGGYERATARLEGISNNISDQIFRYWTQNQERGAQELEVQFDIKSDPADAPPFNTGKNLYIRIRSLRHRVSVPFDKRSRGFIWFFSFLVWFDSIKQQVDADRDLVLLLDEPGLSLHAMAQADLLRYVDKLAEQHQVIYTTHSPFMVHSERLHQVRVVEDRRHGGTIVTPDISGSDDRTLFPLQAALGYTIAQNLFISRKNLLVEGPADLIYLQYFSNLLQSEGRTGLDDDVVIVPVGGLDKLATFVALLGANSLEIVIVHDWARSPEQRLQDLVHRKIIRDRQVLHYGMFRSGTADPRGANPEATDIEDFFNDALYLGLFNDAYARELGGTRIAVKDLANGSRIVERLERTLADKGLKVRPSGGYNHFRVASHMAAHPPARSKISDSVLVRFEALYQAVNACLT